MAKGGALPRSTVRLARLWLLALPCLAVPLLGRPVVRLRLRLRQLPSCRSPTALRW